MKAFISACWPAVITTFLMGSMANSQFVLADLELIGVAIPFSSRLSATLNDLTGLLPGYGAVIAIGFAIAFPLASWCRHRFNTGRWIFPLAGFTSIFAIISLMHPVMEITLIAGARSTVGLMCQCLAGALGGCMFAARKRSQEERQRNE